MAVELATASHRIDLTGSEKELFRSKRNPGQRTINPPKPHRPLSFPADLDRYRLFFEESPIGFVICDMHGRFVLVNQAYADILGRTVDETMRLDYRAFTPKEYEKDDKEQLAELKKTGHFGPFDKHYIRKDSTHVRVRLTLKLLKIDGQDYIWTIVEKHRSQRLLQTRRRLAGKLTIRSLPR